MLRAPHQVGSNYATRARMGVVVALTLFAGVMCHGSARAQNISIPGFGDLTVFAVANFGVLTRDGALGTASDKTDDVQGQSVKSAVGFDWVWDVGYSHKLLGHYEYGGQFTEIENIFVDAKHHRSWIGFSNFLGTLTFGKLVRLQFSNQFRPF